MISQLTGAFVRAFLVALLIAMPSMILPGVSRDAEEISLVIAFVSAIIVLFEYGSSHPGLIEFRFAPPFNRIRFLSLFVTVLLLAVMCRGAVDGTDISRTVAMIAGVIGNAMDFPFSPVRIVTQLLSDGSDNDRIELIRSAAGLCYVVSLLALAFFTISIRLLKWPLGRDNFNLWVNLPTFDPSSKSDIEERLQRDARVNVIFGLTLPFLMPLIASSSAGFFDLAALDNHQTLIWTLSVWAFLPASLFMRGIAMAKLARMIRRKRNRLHYVTAADFSPA